MQSEFQGETQGTELFPRAHAVEVAVWQQRTRNVTVASKATAGRQKLALKRALADKSRWIACGPCNFM